MKYEWKNKEPLSDRFARKVVVIDSGCHLWLGTRNGVGYGLFKVGRKNIRAHRWIYEQTVGSIPTGLELDHLCRTPQCVNPEHLEAVTHAENVRRARLGVRQSHCRKGHQFAPENEYWLKNGSRTCLICVRAKWQRARDKKANAARSSG